MAIRTLPTIPRRTDDPDTFIANTDSWMNALPGWTDDANLLAANLNTIAAGGAYAIPFTFDAGSTATATDPGSGKMRVNNAAQTGATVITVSTNSSAGVAVKSFLATLGDSNSAVKGHIKVQALNDPTRYIIFSVSGITAYAGNYQDIAVTTVSSPNANPVFATGATVMLFFQRTGDIGPAGTIVRRVYATTNWAAPVVDINNYDMCVISAASGNMTLSPPTGVVTDGRQLMFRIKDNGASRTLAYDVIFRAPVEIAFPAATVVGKWTYLGFVYNATDAKWDLVAALSNM